MLACQFVVLPLQRPGRYEVCRVQHAWEGLGIRRQRRDWLDLAAKLTANATEQCAAQLTHSLLRCCTENCVCTLKQKRTADNAASCEMATANWESADDDPTSDAASPVGCDNPIHSQLEPLFLKFEGGVTNLFRQEYSQDQLSLVRRS